MENAVDALKIAAAIVVFVMAIGASFSLFGTAKQTADSIITMRDSQAYLEAAELAGIRYSTAEKIKGDGTQFTKYGDRIVNISDIVSTIYRYSNEKYGVTIIKQTTGEVLARFDSSTESLMNRWEEKVWDGTTSVDVITEEKKVEYATNLKESLKNRYCSNIDIDKDVLEELYKISIRDKNSSGETINRNGVGAPWYGNNDEIQKRIGVNLNGGTYADNNGKSYDVEVGLLELFEGKKIVEVTNEVNQSKYLSDGGQDTNLLQQYNMPTIEIIYIILDSE